MHARRWDRPRQRRQWSTSLCVRISVLSSLRSAKRVVTKRDWTLTEHSPRDTGDQLASKKHAETCREHGDEDGRSHEDHSDQVCDSRAEATLKKTHDTETYDLPDRGGIVDSRLPIGGDVWRTIAGGLAKSLQECRITPERVDLRDYKLSTTDVQMGRPTMPTS